MAPNLLLIFKMRNKLLICYISFLLMIDVLKNILNLIEVKSNLVFNLHKILHKNVKNIKRQFLVVFCFVFKINIMSTIHVFA